MKTTITCLFIVVLLLQNCAPSRFVKPLEKKQQAISFSFGGPIIKFRNAPIPIPFTTLAYGYGLSERATGYISLHTTSLLFGNLQSDMGTTIGLSKPGGRFGVSASPALQVAYNIRNMTGFRIWPSLDLNAYKHIGEKPSYVYGGLNAWFEPSMKKAHDQEQTRHAVPNVHLGYMIVKTKWQHQFEFSYFGIGIPNLPGVVDYIGVSGKGALGIHYSVIRKF